MRTNEELAALELKVQAIVAALQVERDARTHLATAEAETDAKIAALNPPAPPPPSP